jgi:CheY-like chemotaxis protein
MSSDAKVSDERPTVLIVEDEYFLAADLVSGLESRGAIVLGPAPSIEDGLRLISSGMQIDTAVLDINLRGELVFDIADALERRGVPFVFVTGYENGVVPPRFAAVPMFQKPVDAASVCSAVLGN